MINATGVGYIEIKEGDSYEMPFYILVFLAVAN